MLILLLMETDLYQQKTILSILGEPFQEFMKDLSEYIPSYELTPNTVRYFVKEIKEALDYLFEWRDEGYGTQDEMDAEIRINLLLDTAINRLTGAGYSEYAYEIIDKIREYNKEMRKRRRRGIKYNKSIIDNYKTQVQIEIEIVQAEENSSYVLAKPMYILDLRKEIRIYLWCIIEDPDPRIDYSIKEAHTAKVYNNIIDIGIEKKKSRRIIAEEFTEWLRELGFLEEVLDSFRLMEESNEKYELLKAVAELSNLS